MEKLVDTMRDSAYVAKQVVIQYYATMVAMVVYIFDNDIVPYFGSLRAKLAKINTLDDLMKDPGLMLVLGLSTLFLIIALSLLVKLLLCLLRCFFAALCCCCRRRKRPIERKLYTNEDISLTSHRSGNTGERLKEARRWMRQAQQDLSSATNDLSSSNFVAPEWATFKCQQAAEKGLKACLISKDISAINLRGHDLNDLAVLTYDRRLVEIAQKIQGIAGYIGRLRYPDYLPFPHIPHDVISEDSAEEAIGLCNVLLSNIVANYTHPESRTESAH